MSESQFYALAGLALTFRALVVVLAVLVSRNFGLGLKERVFLRSSL